MLVFIFLLFVGAGFTFLSMQNTGVVSLTFLQYHFSDLPVNYVIIGSMLLGALLAYASSMINSVSTTLKIRKQRKQIKQERMEVAELTKMVHQLELENAGLKTDKDPEDTDRNAL